MMMSKPLEVVQLRDKRSYQVQLELERKKQIEVYLKESKLPRTARIPSDESAMEHYNI